VKQNFDSTDVAKVAFRRVKQYPLCVPTAVRTNRLLRVLETKGVPLPKELIPSAALPQRDVGED